MSDSNTVLSSGEVRAILEQVGDCSRLNRHPLTNTQLFQQYLAGHPEKSDLPPGETLVWLLFDIWRDEMYPGEISPNLFMDWHRYLALIVIYFLPLMTGGRPTAPKKLNPAIAKLRRREELLLIVANGKPSLADELLGAPYEEFWLRLIPPDKKLTLPTLSARRDVAVTTLTNRLNARLARNASETNLDPTIANPIEPPAFDTNQLPAPPRETDAIQPSHWVWSPVGSSSGLVFRSLASPIDHWLDEPDKRRRLAGERQTILAILNHLSPTTHLNNMTGRVLDSFPSEPEHILLEKPAILQSLIDDLLSTNLDEHVLRYAVLLQRADLTRRLTTFQIRRSAPWKSHWLTGIEALAEAADDFQQSYFTRAVIRAVLAREDYLLKLWTAHPGYRPVVCDLLAALGKHSYWNREMAEWELIS